jgi:hypothetical protein
VPDDACYRFFFHRCAPPFRSQRFSHISNAIALTFGVCLFFNV